MAEKAETTRGLRGDDESGREESDGTERPRGRRGEQDDGKTDGKKRGVLVRTTSNGVHRRVTTSLAGSIRVAFRRRSVRKKQRTRRRRSVRRTSGSYVQTDQKWESETLWNIERNRVRRLRVWRVGEI